MANTKEDVDINKMYANESKISKEEFIKKYKIQGTGISTEEAEETAETAQDDYQEENNEQ